MLQQWARRYIRITHPRYCSDKRARIRAFFSEGVEKLHLPRAVEALPTLLHLSLFLFFAGLLVFLSNIHHTVFTAAAWWIGLCVAMYTCITFLPIFRHDSPYYAPLSDSAWYFVSGTLFLFFRTLLHSPFLSNSIYIRSGLLMEEFARWFLQGPKRIIEEIARRPSSETDGRVLAWTFDSLDEDLELERFFSCIPGFCSSEVVADPLGTFIRPNEDKLSWALIGLMDRTLASHLVPNTVKEQRTAICVKAIDAASLPLNVTILHRIFSEEWNGFLSSVELGLLLRRKIDNNYPGAASYSHCAISIIISRARERDDRWFELTSGHLGISGSVLRNYLAHGDSVLLANCVHIAQYIIGIYSEQGWTHRAGSKSTLESVTKFNVQCALPGLQHEFCLLWNDTVSKARSLGADHIQPICILALRHLRNAYISLHKGTDAAPTAFSAETDIDEPILDEPWSYPLCNIESHRHVSSTDSTPGTPEVTATATDSAIAVPSAVSANRSPDVVVTTDPLGTGPYSPPSSPPNTQNFSGILLSTVPELQPTAQIIVPSYPDTFTTSIDSTPISVMEPITSTSATLSAANNLPPVPGTSPFPVPTFTGARSTNLRSDLPTPPLSSPSATASSLIAPHTASISNPKAVSHVATLDAQQVAHDLTSPTRAHPHREKVPASNPGMVLDTASPFLDAGKLPQGASGLGTGVDSQKRSLNRPP